jgi:hypothetical protein
MLRCASERCNHGLDAILGELPRMVRELPTQIQRGELRHASAVKTIGTAAVLRVGEIKQTGEHIGRHRQPVHQVGRSFDDDP